MSVPLLRYVKTFQDTETHIEANHGVIQYWRPISADMSGFFELGVSRFTSGAIGEINPQTEEYDNSDLVIMPSVGSLDLYGGEDKVGTLNQYDFGFVPETSPHNIKNSSEEDVWAIWAAVPSCNDTVVPSTITLVNTFEDVPVGTGEDPEDIKRYWVPISEESLGISHFTMGLIFRPPGTEVPYHQHDPPETKEAFVSLNGIMGVQGPDEYYKLHEYDAMYVPQNGRHSNRNIGHQELRYVFIESPAEPELVFL
jgi:oxalate decarboxylase/phosphoglucose isomerase-like protein (cupin superfamily)